MGKTYHSALEVGHNPEDISGLSLLDVLDGSGGGGGGSGERSKGEEGNEAGGSEGGEEHRWVGLGLAGTKGGRCG